MRVAFVGGLMLLALSGGGLAGCGQAAAGEPALLNDLATRVDRSGDRTYTAEYRLDDGSQAVLAQAQEPRRAAYVHQGGKAVFTETELAQCREITGGNRCTLTAPPSPGTDPAVDLLAAAGPTERMVSPSDALRLVSGAALDGATITRYEQRIAGEQSTCVGVHGAAGLSACLTAEGLLSSFTGTVDGRVVSFELTSYAATADAATFALPAGAEIEDRRPR
jgi:hypothetical protein